MSKFTRVGAICLPLAGGFMALGGASAQEAQPAPVAAPQRCTGLICDAYYSSNPETKGSMFLPCRDFICAAFGGRTPDAPTVAQEAAVPEQAPVKPAKMKKKHVAKAATKIAAKDSTKDAAKSAPETAAKTVETPKR